MAILRSTSIISDVITMNTRIRSGKSRWTTKIANVVFRTYQSDVAPGMYTVE